jgi:hypothetical protein
MATQLEPPDIERCQVMKYHPFVMGGDVHQQCRNKPAWIVRETVPGKDGQMGAQSVCEDCRRRWVEHSGGCETVDPTWKWESINR